MGLIRFIYNFKINAKVKSALKRLVESGALKQVKGHGASGSFRISEKVGTAKPKPKKVAKKPKNAVSQPKAPKAKKAKEGSAKVYSLCRGVARISKR